ncbi:MAG: hypothetical protein ACRD3Q_10115, partial [Terriglobales bacterium]
LLPLLTFAAAMFFKDLRHPERMTVVLILLANLSLHGTIIASCFGLVYLIEAARSWRALERPVRKRYIICVVVMGLTFLFLFVILKPTPDVGTFVQKKEIAQLPPEIRALLFATPLRKLSAVVSGAFLDYRAPSSVFIGLAAAWCFVRRRFLLFALPVGGMIALYSFYGYPHHQGTVFVAAIAAFWVAWPTAEEQRALGISNRRAMLGMTALLLCLCGVNIWDAAVVIKHERLYPYSGAEDAAQYLKSVGADRGQIFGYIYGIVGVQAYFDHNILANTRSAYFHQGLPLDGNTVDMDELMRIEPGYLILYCAKAPEDFREDISRFATIGYELVHFSDGYILYKRSVSERQAYFIFRRTGPRLGQGAVQFDFSR